MVKLDRTDKIFLFIVGVFFVVAVFATIFRQEKISTANVEIETKDYVFYSRKETIQIDPGTLCISFYNVEKDYDVKHCGEFTLKYLK